MGAGFLTGFIPGAAGQLQDDGGLWVRFHRVPPFLMVKMVSMLVCMTRMPVCGSQIYLSRVLTVYAITMQMY